MKKIRYKLWLFDGKKRGEIAIDQNYFKAKVPTSSFLKLIYLGEETISVPVNHITSVKTSYRPAWIAAIFFGIGCLCLVFLNLKGIIEYHGQGPAGIYAFFLFLHLFLGIYLILLSIAASTTLVIIDTASGRKTSIAFQIDEREKAKKVENLLNNIVENRTFDTNNRIATENQTKTIVDAINNIGKIE